MSLFSGITQLEKWSSERSCIGKRISLAWHETFKDANLLSVDSLSATTRDSIVYWVDQEDLAVFFDSHRNSKWIIGQPLEGLCWLEEHLDESFEDRFRQRSILDITVLYELFHLVEFGEPPDDGSLSYLSETYLEETMATEDSDFMQQLLDLSSVEAGKVANGSIYSAMERAIAIEYIFPMIWKEALSMSNEKVLLGYDQRALGKYSVGKIIQWKRERNGL